MADHSDANLVEEAFINKSNCDTTLTVHRLGYDWKWVQQYNSGSYLGMDFQNQCQVPAKSELEFKEAYLERIFQYKPEFQSLI